MIAEAMIPISMAVVTGAVLALFFWFRYRMRGEMQQTIRTAIEKGQELTPEIIERLGTPKPPKDRDLRRAIIAIALAAALTIFGFMIPEDSDEAQQVFMGFAAFPFCIGMAFALMHLFTGRD